MKLINISKKIFSQLFSNLFSFNALADLPTAKIGVIDLNIFYRVQGTRWSRAN